MDSKKLDTITFYLCRKRKEKDDFVRHFVGVERYTRVGSVLLYVFCQVYYFCLCNSIEKTDYAF